MLNTYGQALHDVLNEQGKLRPPLPPCLSGVGSAHSRAVVIDDERV